MMHSNLCFKKSQNLIIRDEPQYFESYIAFDFTRNFVYRLDRAVIILLQFLSNHTLCSVCIKNYLENLGCNHSFEELIDKNIIVQEELDCDNILPTITTEPNWIQKLPSKDRKVAILTSPTEVHLVLTRRCNLACVHCNVSASSLQFQDLISGNQWKLLLDELESMQVLKVVITGGEPFLYRDFEEFFYYYGKKKFLKGILTNGTYITDEIAAYMKECNISPVLSIDGAAASVHDEFRRLEGSFDKLLNSLNLLNTHEVTFNLTTVLHKKNISQIRKIVELANNFGAKKLILQPLKPVGRGILATEWFLDNSDYKYVTSEVKKLSIEYLGTRILISESYDFWNLGPKEELVKSIDSCLGATSCAAGTYGLTVDYDGTVYPCMRAMELQLHPIGSILNQSLEDLWKSHKWYEFRTPKNCACRINYMNNMKNSRNSFELANNYEFF